MAEPAPKKKKSSSSSKGASNGKSGKVGGSGVKLSGNLGKTSGSATKLDVRMGTPAPLNLALQQLSVVSFEEPPKCERLTALCKSSLSELKKTKVEILQAMQVELDQVMNASRKRALSVAYGISSLKKLQDEAISVNKKRDRLTQSPDNAKRQKMATERSTKVGAILPAGPKKEKEKDCVLLPGMVAVAEAETSVVKKKKKSDKTDKSKSDGAVAKERRRDSKSKLKKEKLIDGRPSSRPAGEGTSHNDVYPKLAEDHPFWQDVAPFFKKISTDDIARLKRIIDEAAPNDSLCEIPPKGRDYSHDWAEENYASSIRSTAAQRATVLGLSDLQAQESEVNFGDIAVGASGMHSVGVVGEVTKNLMASLIEDDRKGLEAVGIASNSNSKAPYATSLSVEPIGAGPKFLEVGLKRTLTKLGIIDKFNAEKDELVPALMAAQKDLHAKTLECSVYLSQIYSRYRKQMLSDHALRKERLEEELEAVEREIEKAYFQRQAAVRKNQTPSTKLNEHTATLLQKRKELLQRETEMLSSNKTSKTK